MASPAAAHITILVPDALRAHSDGAAELDLEAECVRDALLGLDARYPALALRVLTRDTQLRPFVKLFLRNRAVRDLDGLDTALEDGDQLTIVASVAGG